QKPPVRSVVHGDTLHPEFIQMRGDVLARGRHQRGIEPMIDGFCYGLHRDVTAAKGGDDLTLPATPMLEVARDDVSGRIDAGPVRGIQHAWVEGENTLERCQIVAEIPAAARVDHHASAWNHEVAGEHCTARLVPEREMVGRMPWRMQYCQRRGAAPHDVAVRKRLPPDRVARVLFRRILRE